jgi:hypothetical protein
MYLRSSRGSPSPPPTVTATETAESERAQRRRRARRRRARERGECASEEPKGCGANEHCAAVTLALLGGFAHCTSGPPSGQNGPTRMNSRRLHSGKRSVPVFLGMQAATHILHSPSLVISLCNPPNNHGLHCTSLYTAYQTAPILLGQLEI